MVRRQLRANRTSLIVMAALMLILTTVQVQSYRSAFPDARTRLTLLSELTSNGALRALYGYPYDITTATGWLAWRGMSTAAVIIGIWAAFITIGALRGEEEAGRGEITLSQPRRRRTWLLAVLATVSLEAAAVGTASMVGLAAVGVPQGLMTAGDCAAIALQLILPGLLFAALGGAVAQLVGTTRGARLAAAGLVAAAFLVRIAADTDSGLAWLRWTTPLGWIEELHPPAPPATGALLAIGATCIALGAAAAVMLGIRDVGRGLLPQRDRRRPRELLLAGASQAALRDESAQLAIWLIGALSLALLLGGLTTPVLSFFHGRTNFSAILGSDFGLLAYMAAAFSTAQLIVVLLAVTLVVGARGDEASGRLELLVAGPLSRSRWLLGRTALAATTALALAGIWAVGFAIGAALDGQTVPLGSAVTAALNCLPLIILSVGVTAAVLALAPRAVTFVYAPVAIAYLWQALGTALKAPSWTLSLSPFRALAAVPQEDFAVLPAGILILVGLALMAVSLAAFRRRDLVTG